MSRRNGTRSSNDRTARFAPRALGGALCIHLLSACSGNIAGSGGEGTGETTSGEKTPTRPGTGRGGNTGSVSMPGTGTSGTGDKGTPGQPTTPGVVIPPGGLVDVPACGAGAPVLRRLTRDEYDNTVRDLLGEQGRPGQTFPADVSGTAGFENNVKSLSLPPVLVEKYEETAERMIGDLWRRDTGVAVPMRKVLVCEPAGDGKACARQVLEKFATRAWRRPTTAPEVDRLVKFLDVAKAQGDGYEIGMKLALQAVLMNPAFLFRIEEAAPGQPLDDYAIASRLSYFLWSSMPDDALFALAGKKMLRDGATLRAEAKRMLADAKADALVSSFAGQWLTLRLVEGVSPDMKLFPTVTASLKRAMRLETESFFRAFLKEDRSALDMMDAPFSYYNNELAQHYRAGYPGSMDLKQVKLDAWTKRGGLFTHGSFLAVTSASDRTSVVNRGAWVMDHLLCEPPPPPPPDIPPLPNLGGNIKTQRQRAEAHAKDPACAVCHKTLDPIGFGLENFDAVGVWREQDAGVAIDASGTFRGKPFKGPRELAALIKADPGFPACMVEKLYTYALGRSKSSSDEQALGALSKTFADKGHRLGELVVEMAASPSFATRCADAR